MRVKSSQMEMETLGEGWTHRPPDIYTYLRMLVVGFRIGYLGNVLAAAQNGQIVDPADTLDEDMLPLMAYLMNHPDLAKELWDAGA